MDAGVVSGFLQSAGRFLAAAVTSKKPATASGCGGAGPSAASPLLSDAFQHRTRRGSLHLAPRRSQRRPHPFSATCYDDNKKSPGKRRGFEMP
jgi:hypothetical protein